MECLLFNGMKSRTGKSKPEIVELEEQDIQGATRLKEMFCDDLLLLAGVCCHSHGIPHLQTKLQWLNSHDLSQKQIPELEVSRDSWSARNISGLER